MSFLQKFLSKLGKTGRAVTVSVFALFLAAGLAQAATTISTNIDTGGTLGVTGLSSLGRASSTMLSANTAYFGQTATSTFSSAGALALAGALTGTTASFTSTLGVTGLSSLNQASSTIFSANTAYFGQTATTTVDSAGNVTMPGTLSVTGATTLGVTTSASTTATSFKVGQTGTQLTRATAGYCVTAALAITASTTTMLTCTPSGGTGILTASDRVLVTATSSLPGRVYLSSASSTAAGTIQVNAFNTGVDGGTVSSAAYAFNFWAFQ